MIALIGYACLAYGVIVGGWLAVQWFRRSVRCRCGRGTPVCGEFASWHDSDDCERCDHLRECHK